MSHLRRISNKRLVNLLNEMNRKLELPIPDSLKVKYRLIADQINREQDYRIYNKLDQATYPILEDI